MSWQSEAERLFFDEKKPWSVVDDAMTQYFPELSIRQTHEKVRGYLRRSSRYNPQKKKEAENRPVGVFGDPHIPFDHPGYLPFLIDTFKQYNVGQIICVGDLVDHHALSRHQTEPCAIGAYDELDQSIERVAQYVEAFPKVKMCRGNHDDIPQRQAATVGMGKRFLKSLHELLELPKTWELEDEYIIDDVLYKHGLNCTGKDGVMNAAILERMSTVIGHSHAFGGCKYSANKRSIIFGLNVGCGVDVKAYAMAYGKHAKYRPTLGCGIVFDSNNAIFVPMGMKYFRTV